DVAASDRPAVPQRVAVAHLPIADDRHGLDASMGVIREPGLVVGGIDRLEVVEEQEGVEVVELSSPDAPPEMNAGAFDDRLGRDDLDHGARGLAHAVTSKAPLWAGGSSPTRAARKCRRAR